MFVNIGNRAKNQRIVVRVAHCEANDVCPRICTIEALRIDAATNLEGDLKMVDVFSDNKRLH